MFLLSFFKKPESVFCRIELKFPNTLKCLELKNWVGWQNRASFNKKLVFRLLKKPNRNIGHKSNDSSFYQKIKP